MKYEILLSSGRKVSEFVGIANNYKSDIRVICGEHTASAKSIMGMLALDLKQTLTVDIPDEDAEKFSADIAPFLV